MSEHVPSPADAALHVVPSETAEEFLAEVAEKDGRIFRMLQPPRVFVLTQNPELVRHLERRGARVWRPAHFVPGKDAPMGAYERTPGSKDWEWDIDLASIQVEGLWEAAGEYRQGRRTDG